MKKQGYSQDKLNQMHKRGYYDYLCSDDFAVMYKFAASFIGKTNAKSVLDVGCWNGMFYKALRDEGYEVDYVGFDLSSDAVQYANKMYADSQTTFYAHDWNKPFENAGSTDLIYFGGVFYYIEDKISFLEKFIKNHSPKTIVIQDLQSTDLSLIKSSFNVLGEKLFLVDYNINEARRKRQVIVVEVKA